MYGNLTWNLEYERKYYNDFYLNIYKLFLDYYFDNHFIGAGFFIANNSINGEYSHYTNLHYNHFFDFGMTYRVDFNFGKSFDPFLYNESFYNHSHKLIFNNKGLFKPFIRFNQYQSSFREDVKFSIGASWLY